MFDKVFPPFIWKFAESIFRRSFTPVLATISPTQSNFVPKIQNLSCFPSHFQFGLPTRNSRLSPPNPTSGRLPDALVVWWCDFVRLTGFPLFVIPATVCHQQAVPESIPAKAATAQATQQAVPQRDICLPELVTSLLSSLEVFWMADYFDFDFSPQGTRLFLRPVQPHFYFPGIPKKGPNR